MRKQLSGKEIKELLEILSETLRIFSKKDKVEIFDNLYKLNNVPFLFLYKNQDAKKDMLIPHLKTLHTISDLSKLPCITVDMGAVKFVVGGADIMRPGITNIDDGVSKDEFVVIIDQTHKKPIAVGIAMTDSKEMKETKSGKVIKNIHYVGDELWKIN